MPCHDQPRIERATGRPSCNCKTAVWVDDPYDPRDDLGSVDFDDEGNYQ